MKNLQIAIFGLGAALLAPLASAQVTFYEQEGFHGRTFTTNGPIYNLDPRVQRSRIIGHRRPRQLASLRGLGFPRQCIVLRSGPVSVARNHGHEQSHLVDASRRGVDRTTRTRRRRPPPAPPPYPYYPHHGERLYTADVVAVRAVMGPPEQRCWVEQQQVAAPAAPNVPGAIMGGVLGGVLGHQIGGGRGNDVATAVGAVGGAAIGANVNRGRTDLHAGCTALLERSRNRAGRVLGRDLRFPRRHASRALRSRPARRST